MRPGEQTLEERVNGVGAREHDPVELADSCTGLVERSVIVRRHDSDHRRLDRIGAHLFEERSERADATLERMHAAGGHARLYKAEPDNLTWTGRRLLKPWYLDEVPQLLNVLRGEISLVGPRPWPPEMVRRQVAEGLDYRNRILAGLTGPAQVTKGEGILYVDLDSGYLERYSTLSSWRLVLYDLQILRKTLAVIARGEGLNY